MNYNLLHINCKRMMIVLSVFLFSISAVKADIEVPVLSVEGGFFLNKTEDLTVTMLLESTTMEYVDRVEFYIPGEHNFELIHGSNALSPFVGCGGGQGNQIFLEGPAWVTPENQKGGCGAFVSDTQYKFPLKIKAPYNYNEYSVKIHVRIVGDGYGEDAPTVLERTLTIQRSLAVIVCPSTLTHAVEPGTCEATVQIATPTVIGGSPLSQNYSGTYPIGNHNLKYQTTDVLGRSISCTTQLIVIDTEAPTISGAADVTLTLNPGMCTHVLGSDWTVMENCTSFRKEINQSKDKTILDESLNCPIGDTKFLRVYDMSLYDIHTSFDLTSVDVGIYEGYQGDVLLVNIYKQIGNDLSYESMKLIGQKVEVLQNDVSSEIIKVNIAVDSIQSTDKIVVEAVSQMGNNSLILGFAKSDGTPSYIASQVCSQPRPMQVSGSAIRGAYLGLHGTMSPYIIRKTHTLPYEVGDNVPVGTYDFSFEALDASGNKVPFSLTTTITDNTGDNKALACNNRVYVSILDDCTEVLTSDRVLEGDFYGCYMNYTVEISDASTGYNYGNKVDPSMIGKTLKVVVKDLFGNSCQSELVVEDKTPPSLDCQDIYVSCGADVTPGALLDEYQVYHAKSAQEVKSQYMLPLEIKGLPVSKLEKIRVGMDIVHPNIENVVAMIQAPSGKTVELFSEIASKSDSLNITLSDQATMTHQELIDSCQSGKGCVQGRFQASSTLSVLENEDPNGLWYISIQDITGGVPIKVQSAQLAFIQPERTIPFPTIGDISYAEIGSNTYRVTGIQGCADAELRYSDKTETIECDEYFAEIITRTWKGVDIHGNIITPCTQNIYVFKASMSVLDFPLDYDGKEQPTLSCSLYKDKVPGVDVTGSITGGICSNIHIFPPRDTRIDICGSSYKIIRQFKVLEWCTGTIYEHTQILKIEDKEGPILTQRPEQFVSTDNQSCTVRYFAERPTVVSDCSDEFTFELGHFYSSNPLIIPSDGNYTIQQIETIEGKSYVKDMPLGKSYLRWKVTDACNNVSYEYFTVNVEDKVVPEVTCLQSTDVNIGTDGTIRVAAEVFDNGSRDNCGIKNISVRKMTDTCKIYTDKDIYRDSVYFCCAETGTTVMVEMRVEDEAGNFNTCMVEVRVNDKLGPALQCPDNVSLPCQSDLTDFKLTGRAEAYDNCALDTVYYTDVSNINNCGVGHVERTWYAIDNQGHRASCSQRITLVDKQPFTVDDIEWPKDYETESCVAELAPDSLPKGYNMPILQDDFCSLVDATYKDQVFDFVEGACKKVLRQWTVIDWCTYDHSGASSNGYYTHEQVLKVLKTEAPAVICRDTTVSVYETCSGLIDVGIQATDDCTPKDQLRYTYSIDVDGDGSYEYTADTSSIRRTLDIGTYAVHWKVEDRCGNLTHCYQTITVVEAKKPSPYCKTEVATVIMPSNGSIDIWAKDFNLNSEDNCTPKEELIYSFSSDTSETSKVFYCSDLVSNPQKVDLQMWVTDKAGNQDYCTVTIQLQDNDGLCVQEDSVTVAGRLTTVDGKPLNGVEVSIQGSKIGRQTVKTVDQGQYIFKHIPKNADYHIHAEHKVGFSQGLSTRDLLNTQRHMLEIKKFDQVSQFIAADVDDDKSVTPRDLLMMRKAILKLIHAYPSGKSYVFIPSSTECSDISNPWKCDSGIRLSNVHNNMGHQDMMGVKIGDVNSSYDASLVQQNSEPRSPSDYVLRYSTRRIDQGHHEIIYYASSDALIAGLQLSIDVGMSDDIEVVDMAMDVSEDMVHHKGRDVLMSITTPHPIHYGEGTALFALRIRSDELSSLNVSSALDSELYTDILDIRKIQLEKLHDSTYQFDVLQNIPNPFAEKTLLPFVLPSAVEVKLNVFDVDGRLILERNMKGHQGQNQFVLNREDLSTSGVYYYTIRAGNNQATMKMIKI